MKATSSQKVKIGIFTLVGIALLLVGIFVIGSKQNLFSDTFSVYGTFKNVGGLMAGNNIRFAGINVGTVESIEIINDTTVRVDMRLQQKVKPFLKVDARASIGSDGLMGDKLITIAPGQDGGKLLANGGKILTTDPIDFDKIIERITNVAENAEVITESLASISSQISSGKGSLGKLIYTDDLQRGLVGTVNSAQETIKSVRKGTEGFSENMEALKHNVLLRGYYKKKAKAEQEKADAKDGGTDKEDPKPEKRTRAERRQDRRDARQAAKEE